MCITVFLESTPTIDKAANTGTTHYCHLQTILPIWNDGRSATYHGRANMFGEKAVRGTSREMMVADRLCLNPKCPRAYNIASKHGHNCCERRKVRLFAEDVLAPRRDGVCSFPAGS